MASSSTAITEPAKVYEVKSSFSSRLPTPKAGRTTVNATPQLASTRKSVIQGPRITEDRVSASPISAASSHDVGLLTFTS